MRKITGIVKDPIFLEHKTPVYHPETPQRLEVIYGMLEGESMEGLFEVITPREASRDEVELIHTHSYFDMIASTANQTLTYLDQDTSTSEKSFSVALFAAGSIIKGIEELIKGNYQNIFALVRPPGHHAEAQMAKGFCIFNNIAIGAMYAIKKYSIERILIVDWDLHHGNGTQHSFYYDPRVLYFSTHQYPYYPGTGDISEVGEGEGRGFTINVPLQAGYGDRDYFNIFKGILEPVADIYRPQLVLVSAGFDTYYRDPLGGMKVTPEGFKALTRVVQSIAEKYASNRLLLTLEGGYHLTGLCECIRAVIQQLAGKESKPEALEEDILEDLNPRTTNIIQSVMSVHREFWSCFQ
ncbi:MAG: histone deacetylase family protein [Spirochaetota bacterium]